MAREPLEPLAPIIAPGLKVLFVGINPGLLSAATGHNFARPGNRFYPALHASGFTPHLLTPEEDVTLPRYGLGITNIAPRPTRAASELTTAELRTGAATLAERVRTYAPKLVAIVGVTAYRTAFEHPKATLGLQPETIGGRPVWILPNTSGLNAHHRPQDFARLFREAREHAETL